MCPSPDGSSRELVVGVSDPSGVAEARRRASSLARDLRFGDIEAGRAAIVVTEAATNLLKHGGGGEVLLQAVYVDTIAGLEVLALDRGKGIANLSDALRDGYSTAGSPGTGLGAISRQADQFDIYSAADTGTAIFARLWSRPVPPHSTVRLRIGTACAPIPGEDISADGWVVTRRGSRVVILVVDGVGHGPIAAEARREAVRIFRASAPLTPAELVAAIHAGLRSTRGAAVAVSEIDPERGCLTFCGLGNIGAVILSGGDSRHLVSHNGIAGLAARKIAAFVYPWPPNATLVKHTDGLTTQWDIDRYPGLTSRHPSLVAGILYRDCKRGRDDVAVLVAHASPR